MVQVVNNTAAWPVRHRHAIAKQVQKLICLCVLYCPFLQPPPHVCVYVCGVCVCVCVRERERER